MNTSALLRSTLAGVLAFAPLVAVGSGPAPQIAPGPDVLDHGGGRAVSAEGAFELVATIGGVLGRAVAADPLPAGTVVRAGFAGQLFEVVALDLFGPSSVAEGNAIDFVAYATLDDGTFIVADGPTTQPPAGFFAWGIGTTGTIGQLGVSVEGRVTVGSVYIGTPVSLTVSAAGLAARHEFAVEDADADDWGPYAGDGLRDLWQVQNFGENDPVAAAPLAAPFGDGVVNLLKHAWNVPANDRFNAPVGEWVGGQLRLTYRRLKGHVHPRPTYRVEVSSDLVAWQANGDPGGPFTEEVSVTSLNAETERVVVRDLAPPGTASRRFIRLRVTHP